MSTLTIDYESVKATNVRLSEDTITVDLEDGRTVSAPLAWYPRLMYANKKEKDNWRFIGNGYGIHWEDIDEDISIDNLLMGKASGESQQSFKKWLESR